ncbi:MAG: divalent metal cation transporter [Planctomycetes bacterium]|nr:divalent metal cation transporter [Planctomycetota bacterium]
MQRDEATTIRGLPGVVPPDPAALAADRAQLLAISALPWPRRALSFLARGGPAYLQSALTLGGGTASAAVLSGAAFGYELLWVAPLGMAIGVLMLAALAHQTLSTGANPLAAMRAHAGAVYAWGWALGALIASVIWHFPQYALGAAVLADLGAGAGMELPRLPLGLAILAWSILSSQMYGSRARWMAWLERVVVLLVWATVVCFLVVVVATGIPDWGALARGFTAFSIPAPRGGVSGMELALGGMAAAVVVNMVFLYPYSLLARGWGREHRQRARYDLGFGLFVPYVLAVSLVVIAMANTVHGSGEFAGRQLSPVEAARCFTGVLGPELGRVLFDLGILGMVLTTVTMHMVCAGFACAELCGWPFGSWRHRLAMLLPAPGVLGSVLWQELSVYVAVPTSILVGCLLPLVYVGILRLHRSRRYLGGDRPEGWRGRLWTAGMALAILVVVAFLGWYVAAKRFGFLGASR